MKAMIIGSTGYLGVNLLHYLVERHHEVVDPSTLLGKRFDLRDNSQVNAINWNVDVIYMFAGLTGTANSFQTPSEFLNTNVNGLNLLLKSVAQSRFRPRLIFPSTRLIYKGSASALSETAPQEARTVYAASKIAAERLLQAYGMHFDIPSIIVRVCVPYGQIVDGPYRYGTVGFMLEQARTERVIKLFNCGKMRRTFTHVLDLCELFLRLGGREREAYEVFNVPGEDMSLREVAEAIANRLGVGIEMIEWQPSAERVESGDTIFDGAKLSEELGWSPSCRFHRWVETLTT